MGVAKKSNEITAIPENSLHWQLDMSFGEDQNRTRKDHAAANLGVLRRMSLSLLKNEKGQKVGI